MTVFKAFLKVLNKNKFIAILYTIVLVVFGAFNMQTSENQTSFVASKPDVLIINNDENIGLTKNLVEYIENNSNIIEIKNDEDAINDALFYRDVNYIIYIPKDYRQQVLERKRACNRNKKYRRLSVKLCRDATYKIYQIRKYLF